MNINNIKYKALNDNEKDYCGVPLWIQWVVPGVMILGMALVLSFIGDDASLKDEVVSACALEDKACWQEYMNKQGHKHAR